MRFWRKPHNALKCVTHTIGPTSFTFPLIAQLLKRSRVHPKGSEDVKWFEGRLPVPFAWDPLLHTGSPYCMHFFLNLLFIKPPNTPCHALSLESISNILPWKRKHYGIPYVMCRIWAINISLCKPFPNCVVCTIILVLLYYFKVRVPYVFGVEQECRYDLLAWYGGKIKMNEKLLHNYNETACFLLSFFIGFSLCTCEILINSRVARQVAAFYQQKYLVMFSLTSAGEKLIRKISTRKETFIFDFSKQK